MEPTRAADSSGRNIGKGCSAASEADGDDTFVKCRLSTCKSDLCLSKRELKGLRLSLSDQTGEN